MRKRSLISFKTIKKLSAQKYNIRLETVRKVREFTNFLKCLQIVNLVNLLFEMWEWRGFLFFFLLFSARECERFSAYFEPFDAEKSDLPSQKSHF